MNKSFRIVFMGTPGFAVTALDALVKNGANIVAVVTAPDKPAGRGLQLKQSEVKQYALEHHLNVLQPEKLKDPGFVNELSELKPDLAVVVAFRMLPEVVWSLPAYGTINLHASLLPQYRGAAPINWAIINGESVTGVTTFFIEKEIDTGKIIGSRRVDILPNDTAGTLHDKLALTGSTLLVETVSAIAEGTCSPVPQEKLAEGLQLKPAPKIFREHCKIDWGKPVDEVYNFIRGLSPYPGAWTVIHTGSEEKTLKILECSAKPGKPDVAGAIVVEAEALNVACAGGYISVTKLQPEGKKVMTTAEYLRGLRNPASFKMQ